MSSKDRLLPIAIGAVQVVRVLNVLVATLVLLMLIATFAAEDQLAARLAAKYGSGADIPMLLTFLRGTMLLVVPTTFVVERLLKALRAILASVAAGEPFAPANGARLRTIGWMLLALQLIDLGMGGASLIADRLGVDYVGWTPSLTGWIAVLVAFVLVRVFAAGTALRDDLEGTV